MINNPKTEDRELDLLRKQWSAVAPPSPEFRRQVYLRIKAQDRRFWLGNLVAAAAFVGTLILALYQLTHDNSRLERTQATGVCVLLFVAVSCRLWNMRGTWRTETQSTRAFVNLWQRRVLAQIRGLQIGIFLAIGWLGFGAVLVASNWATIRLEVMPHPIACLALVVLIALVLPAICFGAMRFRRHKLAELEELTRILEGIETTED